MKKTPSRPACMDLLRPEALARLANQQFIARGVVEGSVTGRHQSPYKGFSAEFAEHRQYVAGDDTRALDWRVLGRSDRYYIKQYVDETNLRATILLDASGSMKYVGDEAARVGGRRISKFEYARYMAASMAYLMIKQQDAVGFVSFDESPRAYVPARSRPTHLRVLLEQMHAAQPNGETSLATVFHTIAERIPRRGLVLIFSDLLDEVEPLLQALQHFRHRKHEVVLFHILAEEERTFPFSRWTVFDGLENPGDDLVLDPRAIRAEYLDRLAAFQHRLEVGCGQMEIDYVTMSTRESYDIELAKYLAKRMDRRQ
ncbi:MAG: DUF58 domain-containing protein [Pirellulales bacterium]